MNRISLFFALIIAVAIVGCGKPNPLGPDDIAPTPVQNCVMVEQESDSYGSRELRFNSPGDRGTPYPNVDAFADSNVFEADVSLDYVGADGNVPPPIVGWAQDRFNSERRIHAVWGVGPTYEPAFYFPNANGTYHKKMRLILPYGSYDIWLSWTDRTGTVRTAQLTAIGGPNATQWHPELSISASLKRWDRVCR